MMECGAYSITMHTFDAPSVDANFVAGAKFLPLHFEEEAYYRSTLTTHPAHPP